MNMLPEPTRLLRLILSPALLATAGLAVAQQPQAPGADSSAETEESPPRYGVELIVFTYDASVSAGTEIFVPDAPPDAPVDDAASTLNPYPGDPRPGRLADTEVVPDPEDVENIPTYGDMDLLPGPGNLAEEDLAPIMSADSIELRVLPAEALTMTAIHEKLLLLDAYRPVLWSGWTQIVREDEETPVIRLRRLGNLPLEMDGELKLYLSRFLHLVVDVSMQAPSTQPAVPPSRRYGDSPFALGDDGYGYPAPPVHFRIRDDRILKSDEIRYFDHPKFGILAKLTRVEEPQDGEPETDAPVNPTIVGDGRPAPAAMQ